MATVKRTPKDVLAAIDAARSVHDCDSRGWARVITEAFERFGGVESLIHALASELIAEMAARHSGDAFEVRRELLARRDLADVEVQAVATGVIA
ncbi:hypothetical protein GOEFS_046_00650 [Gordonia effusa NBRC 100432]|uniref:Uncharacterized protein n=1 Tax=Gordonia effusa NBRC 100432 TaxID=1077974 RepID=H0QZ58_9ACTN|nr:hypothetical protein [Gordonia effusa]GAB18109.1 hypothetical protein GOEFS_046_00650 [Gordonia effusa NBRC 100432]